MAYSDRVACTSTSTGTGSLTLGAAETGYRAPSSVFSNGTSGLHFVITDGTDWEVSSCTLVDASTLSRDTVLSSSNGDALVSFAAGSKTIYHDVPASVLNDLMVNRPVNAAVVTTLTVASDHIPIVQAGALNRITVENLISQISTSTPGLSAAGALSGTDIIAITQDGVNEVRTTLSAIASFIAAFLGGGNTAAGVTLTVAASVIAGAAEGAGAASGVTMTTTASLIAGTAEGSAAATASGVTITATASLTAGSASGATSYTITGYSGNTVNTTADATAWSVYAGYLAMNSVTLMTSSYWNISPTPASACGGWGTSNSTPPSEITAAQNTSPGYANGLQPLSPASAPSWYVNGYLRIQDGVGTSGPWYFWVKPADGAAQCMNSGTGLTVSNC